MRLFAALAAAVMTVATPISAAVDLNTLAKGQTADGFKVTAVYLNDVDKPMGARFVHRKTGFTLDLLRIESVPQGYTWVNSFPVSDQGEPHTQEHLLLGKGTTGRAFAGLDTMWLAQSNAFTQQWRTSYHFNTSAGPAVFFDLFAAQLNALLNPNYTDEEIKREVRNFGVTQNPDGTLRLEEKGTVYNEMTSSSGNPYRVLFRAADLLVYGPTHPLAYNSGGEPSGIRTMQPEDIRRFHDANYYLANMGTIVSFPSSVAIDDVLKRVDAILTKLEPEGSKRAAKTQADLPAPAMAEAGKIVVAEYPQKNDQQPSPIAFVWPATRNLGPNDKLLLDGFVRNIAGDATTNLYKLFIDSKTRVMDIGAKQIFTQTSDDQGQPLSIVFTDVAVANLTPEKLAAIRDKVVAEIERIASLPDGSPELKEFNGRLENRSVELQRDLAKFVNSPPGFGFRNSGSDWMDQLLTLERTPDFKKSVTLKPQLAYMRGLLASKKNFWREKLAAWKVAGVVPYVTAAKPSPELAAREDAERIARSNAEAERLAKLYSVTDTQEAIKKYRVDYDIASARIDDEAKKIAPPQFVKTPPMTLDDALTYEVQHVAPSGSEGPGGSGGTKRQARATPPPRPLADARGDSSIPLVVSRFDNMTSAQLGLALRLDSVPREQLRYVSLLPSLLTRVGVIENGKPVPYEEMTERLRKEILSLDAAFATNARTRRVELIVRGAGIGTAEAERAIRWMSLVLEHPDWRPENLARIRDVVDQDLSRLRNTMQGPEEAWVLNPATAYRMQTSPVFLAADSFLTRGHNALRLRWMLKDASASDREAVASYLAGLAGNPPSRADVKKLAAPDTLSASAKKVAADAIKDLDQALVDVPDSSLAADWAQLCNELAADLRTSPADALAHLDAVRREILHRGNARMYLVGSTANEKTLAPRVTALASALDAAPVSRVDYGTTALLDARVHARDASVADPVYLGLFAPNMKGGVVINSVPGVQYADFADKDKQLDYLASRLFGGYGAHGIFLKTIGAGLAYSNGLRASVASGRMGYYAERTPELPQTVRFVINELKNAPRNTDLTDYSVAQVFGEIRSAATYEARAEGIAADLADGQTPDQVRKFRASILELRKDPQIGEKLWDRKDKVYGEVLPGYNVNGKDVPDAVYFVIGPDKQLDAWSEYLKGSEETLVKLYGRDFWVE